MRTRARTQSMGEVINRLGENMVEEIMIKCDWRCVGKNLEMDDSKVDYNYRKEHASIDIQLKSANINPKRERWVWQIIKRGKKLDLNFYSEPGSFLFLAAFYVKKTTDYFKEIKVSHVAMIPGDMIVKFFENNPQALQITIRELKLLNSEYPYWLPYFGRANIAETLKAEEHRQNSEYSNLKK